jgi:hypothetical protein
VWLAHNVHFKSSIQNSKLRLTKTYLRSTTRRERLRKTDALLSTEAVAAEFSEREKTVDECAGDKARRKTFLTINQRSHDILLLSAYDSHGL